MKIGFIGLGIMGSRMAANLLDNNYEVIVFNRSKDKAERLIEKGAEWGGSIEKTAGNSDILISMVSTPKAVGDIAFSDDCIIANLKKDTLWINSSTINPSFAELTAMKAVNAGIRYLGTHPFSAH